MSSKPSYAPPGSPPPNYSQAHPTSHISQQDTGPSSSYAHQQQPQDVQYGAPFSPPMSPGPDAPNKITPYNANQAGHIAPPDPAYGGFYNHNPQGPYGPPAQGYYGPPGPNMPGPGPNMSGPGYYAQPGPQPGMYQQGGYYQQPQPMYGYPQQQPYGYYQDNRPGAGSGICAGLLGALACCCCMDMLLF